MPWYRTPDSPSREWLMDEFLTKKRGYRALCQELGVSSLTLRRWLKDGGILDLYYEAKNQRPPLCACGCGERVANRVKSAKFGAYRPGHNAKVPENKPLLTAAMIAANTGKPRRPEHTEKARRSRLANAGKDPNTPRGAWKIYGPKRTSPGYSTWRTAVLKRDGYACRHCGAQPKTLHAHHILSFKGHPDRRHDVDNGLTLCPSCHVKMHPHMRKGVA